MNQQYLSALRSIETDQTDFETSIYLGGRKSIYLKTPKCTYIISHLKNGSLSVLKRKHVQDDKKLIQMIKSSFNRVRNSNSSPKTLDFYIGSEWDVIFSGIKRDILERCPDLLYLMNYQGIPFDIFYKDLFQESFDEVRYAFGENLKTFKSSLDKEISQILFTYGSFEIEKYNWFVCGGDKRKRNLRVSVAKEYPLFINKLSDWEYYIDNEKQLPVPEDVLCFLRGKHWQKTGKGILYNIDLTIEFLKNKKPETKEDWASLWKDVINKLEEDKKV